MFLEGVETRRKPCGKSRVGKVKSLWSANQAIREPQSGRGFASESGFVTAKL
jgi:hypothetical protein